MATQFIPKEVMDTIPKQIPVKYEAGRGNTQRPAGFDPESIGAQADIQGRSLVGYYKQVDVPNLPEVDAKGFPLPRFFARYDTNGVLQNISASEPYWATTGQGENDIFLQPKFNPQGELVETGENTNKAAGGSDFISQLGRIATETAPIWMSALGANLFTGANLLGGGAGAAAAPAATESVAGGLMGSALPATAGTGGSAALSAAVASQGLIPSVLSSVSNFTGLSTDTLGKLGSTGVQTLLSSAGASQIAQQGREAAQTQADAQVRAAQIAADAAKFRPVGVTTRFGQSAFATDAQGNVIGAGYSASPEIQGYQNRLSALAGQGLTQAEQAATAYQPLTGAAQSLFSLGQGYLAKSPEQAAADNISKQQALLAPSQENQLALLQNKLFQQGRTGAATAQGGNLMATNPEMAAYYNSIAQSNLALAAQADQEARNRITYGAGLFDTGANLQNRFYSGQTAAYAPFANAMDTTTKLEGLAQQPMNLGTSIGSQTTAANTLSGSLLSSGITQAAQTMAAPNAYSASGNLLSGIAQNPMVTGAINNAFGVQSSAPKYQIINGQLVQVA